MLAGKHHVLPARPSALGARFHVVDCRLTVAELDSAILTLVVVSTEEIYAAKRGSSLANMDKSEQPHHSRHFYRQRD